MQSSTAAVGQWSGASASTATAVRGAFSASSSSSSAGAGPVVAASAACTPAAPGSEALDAQRLCGNHIYVNGKEIGQVEAVDWQTVPTPRTYKAICGMHKEKNKKCHRMHSVSAKMQAAVRLSRFVAGWRQGCQGHVSGTCDQQCSNCRSHCPSQLPSVLPSGGRPSDNMHPLAGRGHEPRLCGRTPSPRLAGAKLRIIGGGDFGLMILDVMYCTDFVRVCVVCVDRVCCVVLWCVVWCVCVSLTVCVCVTVCHCVCGCVTR
jgi:hypothetical protein